MALHCNKKKNSKCSVCIVSLSFPPCLITDYVPHLVLVNLPSPVSVSVLLLSFFSLLCSNVRLPLCGGVLCLFVPVDIFDFWGDFRFRDGFSWPDLHMPGVCEFDPFNNSLACYTCRAQEATSLCFLHEPKPEQACVKAHIFSTSVLQHLQQHIVHL